MPLKKTRSRLVAISHFFSRRQFLAKTAAAAAASSLPLGTLAQYSLKWILGDPAMTAVVTETSRPHHVVDNMTAAYGEFPDQATRRKMSDFLLALG